VTASDGESSPTRTRGEDLDRDERIFGTLPFPKHECHKQEDTGDEHSKSVCGSPRVLMAGAAFQSEKEKYGASSDANAADVIHLGKCLLGRSSLDVELQTDSRQNERDGIEWQIDVDCWSMCQLKSRPLGSGLLTAPSPADRRSENTSQHRTKCTRNGPNDSGQTIVLCSVLQWEDIANDDRVQNHHSTSSNTL
jgi:hypothetical protein